MKDVVIGCITNYTFDRIKNFVNSIEQSSFDGYKVMIVYNVPKNTVSELENRGWIVMSFNYDEKSEYYLYKPSFRIMCDRHLHYYETIIHLQSEFGNLRYVIALDPKDVILQSNPSDWLEKNIGDKKINVGCESIRYRDESWGRSNLAESFGESIYERCKDNLIFNCGTLAGEWKTMSELFLNIYTMCVGSPNQTPDQAALNILLSMDVYKNNTNFAMSEDGWACQAGTTVDERLLQYHRDKLVEPCPYLDEDIVKTNKGIPFVLVHQYDRIPKWNNIITKKFNKFNNFKILPEPKSNDNAPGFLYKKWKQFRDFGKYDNSYNEMLKDKRVIIVGPSPSLEGKGMGEYIDSFDIVVRINKAFPVEKEMTKDIGTRTDIHYHCLCTEIHCGGPVFYQEMKEANVFVSCPYPKWIGPFYNDVARFENDNKKWDLGFHILNTHYYMNISEMLGTRANSGTLTILDLLCYDVKELHITGFTWFRDGWRKSYKDHTKIFGEEEGKRKEEKWLKGEFDGNHKQKPQEDLVREIYLNDDRVSIDDTMKQILEVK